MPFQMKNIKTDEKNKILNSLENMLVVEGATVDEIVQLVSEHLQVNTEDKVKMAKLVQNTLRKGVNNGLLKVDGGRVYLNDDDEEEEEEEEDEMAITEGCNRRACQAKKKGGKRNARKAPKKGRKGKKGKSERKRG